MALKELILKRSWWFLWDLIGPCLYLVCPYYVPGICVHSGLVTVTYLFCAGRYWSLGSLAHCVCFALVRELPGKVPGEKIPSELGSLTLSQSYFCQGGDSLSDFLGHDQANHYWAKGSCTVLQSSFLDVRRGDLAGFAPLSLAFWLFSVQH